MNWNLSEKELAKEVQNLKKHKVLSLSLKYYIKTQKDQTLKDLAEKSGFSI